MPATITLSQVITEKQLSKIGLFETVRKVKGELYFRHLHRKSLYKSVPEDMLLPELCQRRFFVYVVVGQVHLYKHSPCEDLRELIENSSELSHRVRNRCFLRSYQSHEHFGYQEYPLYWGEELIVKASQGTKLILFPLESFYKTFSGLISLVGIQSTAEYLKRVPVFREVEMEKLLRLSTFCFRVRTHEHTIIAKEGDPIFKIVLVCEGRVSVTSSEGRYFEESNGFVVGQKQAELNFDYSCETVKSLVQSDLMVIPLTEYLKVSKIRNKLREHTRNDFERRVESKKSRNASKDRQLCNSNLSDFSDSSPRKCSYREFKTLEQQRFKHPRDRNFFADNERTNTLECSALNKDDHWVEFSSVNRRPQTSSVYSHASRPRRKFKDSSTHSGHCITYSQDGRQVRMSKTQGSFHTRKNTRSISCDMGSESESECQSLSRMTLSKFISRKQQIQNREFQRLVNSRLPETVLNAEKEYALMKPLIQKNSSYVKNYKRRLKHNQRNNTIIVPPEQVTPARVKLQPRLPKSFQIKRSDL